MTSPLASLQVLLFCEHSGTSSWIFLGSGLFWSGANPALGIEEPLDCEQGFVSSVTLQELGSRTCRQGMGTLSTSFPGETEREDRDNVTQQGAFA